MWCQNLQRSCQPAIKNQAGRKSTKESVRTSARGRPTWPTGRPSALELSLSSLLLPLLKPPSLLDEPSTIGALGAWPSSAAADAPAARRTRGAFLGAATRGRFAG